MHEVSVIFIVIGSLLLLGLATDYLGRKTALPRITLLFLFGFLLGPGVFGVLPQITQGWLPLISDTALLLVGFLLGGKVTWASLKQNGRNVLFISISVVLSTIIVVGGGLYLLGVPFSVAILLAGVATATDPVATMDVIKENKSNGKFTDTLQGIVAVDDAWGLIAFSVILAIVSLQTGNAEAVAIITTATYELVGAVVLGFVLGVPMAFISGRIKPGQPTLIEALGMVFLCGGIAQWLEVSFLLAAMIMGIVVANFAKHHEQEFHEIEDIEWPFMILFFVLTGASLDPTVITNAGVITVAYIVLRVVARLAGSWPGGIVAGDDREITIWMGFTLLPQAGVATGMALIAAHRFPELRETLIAVVVVATVIFEMIGPICTRWVLVRVSNITISS